MGRQLTGAEMTEMTEEVWTYLGLRASSGKRSHAWHATGKTLLYADTGHFVLGGLYVVRVRRAGDSVTRTKPAYTGRRSDSVDRAELAALDSAAEQELARRRRERSDAARDELDQAIAPLLAIARKLPTRAARRALQRLGQGWQGR